MQTHPTQSPSNPATNSTSRSPAHLDVWRQPPERCVDVGHSQLAYWRFGQGPDVLFVHGWPVSASTFRAVVAELADGYTCHLIDLPGAGHTRTPDLSVVGLRQHAETVNAALDALGLNRVALVAHDSGGAIARLAAAARPERIAGLVLGNTEIPGHVPGLIKLLSAALAVPGGGRLFIESLRLAPLRRSRSVGFGTCFEDQRLIDGDFYELVIAPLLKQAESREGALALIRNLDVRDFHALAGVHAQLTMPVRFIWGAKDPVFPLSKARRMPEQLAGPGDLVTLEDGWLFAHEEYPEAFAAHTRAWLTRCFG